jgi:hypothetical protein
VILDPKTPGARDARVIDTDTGAEIQFVCRLDSETGFVERLSYVDGKPELSEDGSRYLQIEERRNFRVVHRTTGQLICQHPR